MFRMRVYVLGSAVAALAAIAFFAGRASAQQPSPTVHTAAYSFPLNWGELKETLPGPTGFTYVFEHKNGSSDSSIRLVHTGAGGLEAIEVIRRN